MRIQNNTSAFNVWASYSQNTAELSKSMTRLSTGQKSITDDAAGIGMSENMRAEIKGVEMARQNVSNGISLVQTADSWLQKISDMLGRMKALTVESQGIVSATDKSNIQEEYAALNSEIGRITGASTSTAAASFNGIELFNGTAGSSGVLKLQIGATQGQTMDVTLTNLSGGGLVTASSAGAANAITTLSDAVNKIASTRAKLGAQQVRLEHSNSGLTAYEDNLRSSESKMRDIDFARESTKYAKYQIMTNASTSILAQSNQLPSSVLSLLG